MARTRRHRKKRQVFSDRQKQAIERIAIKPAETKHMDQSWTINSLLVTAGYIGGETFAIRGSVFNHIPRENNSVTKSEHTYIGNEIMMRGFRWEFMGYPVVPNNTPDIKFRFTVYDDPIPYTTLPVTAGASGIFDGDFINVPTWARWNPQSTKIRFQRHFTVNQSSIGASNIHKKYYIPIRRKLTSAAEESTALNTFFGVAKQEQIYWVLECLAPSFTALDTQFTGYVQSTVYFKDP